MEKAEKLQILSDIVAFDTENKDESLVANYLSDLLKKHGIDSEKVTSKENRDNLVATIGDASKSNKVLGMTGHMDVVSVGDRSKWTTDPFKMDNRGGNLYGRGTSDMKSGLAALVIAMIELKEENVSLNGTAKLLATMDEEISETGAQTLNKLGYAKDLTALIVAEPSGASKEMLKASQQIINMTDDQLNALLDANQTNEQHFVVYAHNGSFDFKVTSIGKTAHSSMPSLGINAIDNLMEYYNLQNDYFKHATAEDEVLGKIIPEVTLINGGEQINSIPGKAYLVGRVRTTPAIDGDKITNDLDKIIANLNEMPGYNLKLEVINNQPPVKSNPNDDFIKLVQKLGSEHLKQTYPLLHVAGGTDAAHLAKDNPNLPVTVIGPGNNTSHMIDEYADEEMYLLHIDYFKDIITKYLK